MTQSNIGLLCRNVGCHIAQIGRMGLALRKWDLGAVLVSWVARRITRRSDWRHRCQEYSGSFMRFLLGKGLPGTP
jgi:hypothetical protein